MCITLMSFKTDSPKTLSHQVFKIRVTQRSRMILFLHASQPVRHVPSVSKSLPLYPHCIPRSHRIYEILVLATIGVASKKSFVTVAVVCTTVVCNEMNPRTEGHKRGIRSETRQNLKRDVESRRS